MPFTDQEIKLKGVLSEIHAQVYYLETGWDVFTPVNVQTRADFVIVHRETGEVKKVQVKSIQDNPVDGVPYRQCRIQPHNKPYESHEVDLFFFVHPPTGDMWEADFLDLEGQTSVNVGRADGLGRSPKNAQLLRRVR